MKIYLDLLFIQNFFVTSLIIFILNKISCLKIKFVRILLIAFLDSIFEILIIVYLPNLFNSFWLKFLNAFLLIKFGLKIKELKNIFAQMAVLVLLTMLFGGEAYFCNGVAFKMLLIFTISAIAIIKFCKKNRKKLFLESATCFIEFEYLNKKYNLKCLIDTGNSVKTIFDENVIFVKENLFVAKGGDVNLKRKVRYKTVSGTEEKVGIKIMNIKIKQGEKNIKNNAVIVSTPNISNDFDAIVSLDFIGGESDGNFNVYESKSKKVVS